MLFVLKWALLFPLVSETAQVYCRWLSKLSRLLLTQSRGIFPTKNTTKTEQSDKSDESTCEKGVKRKFRRCSPNRCLKHAKVFKLNCYQRQEHKRISFTRLYLQSLIDSRKKAAKLHVRATAAYLTVHGINSQEVVDAREIQLKFTPAHSGDTDSPTFDVKLFVSKHPGVVNDFINVDRMKQQDPHLEPILLKGCSYANVEMILGYDTFHVIQPLKYLETDRKGTAIAVLLPLVWILIGPLPSTSGIFSTCFEVVTQIANDFTLADQFGSWYDLESFGAYKEVDLSSASDNRGQKIFEDTTYHDRFRYQDGMLWAGDSSSFAQ